MKMAQKLAIVCLAAVVLGQAAAALDLIELTDANQAKLNLELSKAVGGVQAAYKNEFKFEQTSEVRKFLAQCQLVESSVAGVEDSAFEGLAKQVKAIAAEPTIKQACSITEAQLTEDFDQLDDLSKGDTIYAPLSSNVLNLLVALSEKVKADPALSSVAGHLVKAKVDATTEALLDGAPNDVEVMVGETQPSKGFFDFSNNYRKFCQISLIEPVCKLVRNTNLEVEAIAADVNKFTEMLKSGSSEVAEHTKNSGVTLEHLKLSCEQLKRQLRPIEQIKKYVAAGLLNEEQLAAHRATDSSLDSYVSLYDLCQQAQQ